MCLLGAIEPNQVEESVASIVNARLGIAKIDSCFFKFIRLKGVL